MYSVTSQSAGTSVRNAPPARPRSISASSGAVSAPWVRCWAPGETCSRARATMPSEPTSCPHEAATSRASASSGGPSCGRAAAKAAVERSTVRSTAASTAAPTLS